MERISHWVNNKVVKGTSGNTGKVFNPATGEQQAEVDVLGCRYDALVEHDLNFLGKCTTCALEDLFRSGHLVTLRPQCGDLGVDGLTVLAPGPHAGFAGLDECFESG